MGKRRKTPKSTETEVLVRSGRCCCLCAGLHQDWQPKQGQIVHLDGDPSNSDIDNLAWLCLNHHATYDSKSRQAKGITRQELKTYRDRLSKRMEQIRVADLPKGMDVPLLSCVSAIGPRPGVPQEGILLTDNEVGCLQDPPQFYLSIYFKRSPYFGEWTPNEKERWLYLEAHMRPAFSLRIQVRAWNRRDIDEFMELLHEGKGKWDLFGLRPECSDLHSGDHLHMEHPEEEEEYRLVMSTLTATNAAVSIHARLSEEAAGALAKYLEDVGFASDDGDFMAKREDTP